ncbi:MAG: tetratricopeptide repeat protein [Pyrinomonadaceae bacterium]
MEIDNRKYESGSQPESVRLPVSIRAYTPFYAAAILLLIFFALLSLYLSFNIIAAALFVVAFLVVPILRTTDKIVFDGRRLVRTGLIPKTWFRMNGLRSSIRLRKMEHIGTNIVGSFRRGGRVRYLFRTTVFGNGPVIVFSGGGKRYRQMVRALFPKLDPNLLDCQSSELSRFLVEPHQANLAAAALKIPSSDVLSPAIFKRSKSNCVSSASIEVVDPQLATELRNAANQLRMNGSLIRAFEAFRRALRIDPNNGWLLFEFARNCFALSHVERNPNLHRRGAAALRLAEKRAVDDPDLLERIGESYRQFGYSKRAASAYKAAVEKLDACFRALIGLAELALDEGKLAHVVHNFSAANRVVPNAELRKWTSNEVEYFSHLTGDDEYMELEISRMNLVEKLDRWRSVAFRIGMYSIPLIAAGILFNEYLVTDAGWLVSSAAFILWIIMSIGAKMLAPRIPYSMVENEN